MRAVSNTSPISNLASIDRLGFLRSQFPELWIPDAVAQELRAHPDIGARSRIERALQEGWFQVGSPRDSPLLRILQLQLHPGEAETIALAADIGADIVLIDEQEGRQFAAKAGVAVTGVLGILLRAKRAGELNAVKPAIDELRRRASFFVSASLEARIVAAAGE
jgi:predicted nucleic acid-binding protein